MTTISYKTAGVDIEAGNEAVRRIKRNVEKKKRFLLRC